MSFSFGFSDDDVDIADNEVQAGDENLINAMRSSTLHEPQSKLLPSKFHTLQELLRDVPSQLSYNVIGLNQNQADKQGEYDAYAIPRRSVFDIRTQLMAEASLDDADEADQNDTLIAGLERGDLTSGVYEGGFKTWECAVDLASFVAGVSDILGDERDIHIIELGAGSAIPSLLLLIQALSRDGTSNGQTRRTRRVHFTLCDYNLDVLRLCTAPNIFLTATLAPIFVACASPDGAPLRSPDQAPQEPRQRSVQETPVDTDIEDIDEAVVLAATDKLRAANITVDFVSGAWGTEFIDIIQNRVQDLYDDNTREDVRTVILASETIYSPSSIAPFTRTLMSLLQQSKGQQVEQRTSSDKATWNTQAFIAAKKVYFGVGGGVQDFRDEVARQGGQVREVLDVSGARVGVGRVVLEVSVA